MFTHFVLPAFNPLTPNDLYMSRTAPLTSKRCILYIYSTNVGTKYFKHALYSPFFFSSKYSLFHNANFFGSCIIHILYTGCAEIKTKNSGAKGLNTDHFFNEIVRVCWQCPTLSKRRVTETSDHMHAGYQQNCYLPTGIFSAHTRRILYRNANIAKWRVINAAWAFLGKYRSSYREKLDFNFSSSFVKTFGYGL